MALHIVGQEHVLILVLVRVLLFELSRELQQFVVPLLAFLFLSVLLLASVAQLLLAFSSLRQTGILFRDSYLVLGLGPVLCLGKLRGAFSILDVLASLAQRIAALRLIRRFQIELLRCTSTLEVLLCLLVSFAEIRLERTFFGLSLRQLLQSLSVTVGAFLLAFPGYLVQIEEDILVHGAPGAAGRVRLGNFAAARPLIGLE